MRFSVVVLLDNETIAKDKNRIIISLIKHNFQAYDQRYYESVYESNKTEIKSFTFSIFMQDCKFTRDEIIIPGKKIILNFATNDMKDGIMFYNAFLNGKGKQFPVRDNILTINQINMITEKVIMEEQIIFKTMSPIVVREHHGDNTKTWYHSLNNQRGEEIFIGNLRNQLLNEFGEDRLLDINDIDVEVLRNKEVKVKNYGIEVVGNICEIKIYAKSYILNYLYKSGIGSMKSGGFGMVNLV